MQNGAELDALAALEAEYAAVVAQSTPSAQSAEAANPVNSQGDAESAGSDSDDSESAAVGGFETYALLPSSPVNSEAEGPFSNDEEDAVGAAEAEEEENAEENIHQEDNNEPNSAMEEDTRKAIMQSMQHVQLRPPPWAQAAKLTDDELVAMVKQQLQLGTGAAEGK